MDKWSQEYTIGDFLAYFVDFDLIHAIDCVFPENQRGIVKVTIEMVKDTEIVCPSCGSYDIRVRHYIDKRTVPFKCSDCGYEWDEDKEDE